MRLDILRSSDRKVWGTGRCQIRPVVSRKHDVLCEICLVCQCLVDGEETEVLFDVDQPYISADVRRDVANDENISHRSES